MTSYLGRKAQDVDYGIGEHSFDADSLGLIDEQELTQRLVKTFNAPNYQPPRLPAVAMELLSVSRNPDVEFETIEKLLEQDAMLTGEILALARSSAYAGHGQVLGLQQALVRLGLKKLGEVVMTAAMNMRVFRSKVYQQWMDRLRHHSLATAHICRFVARYTPFEEEHAFLCGLLHDVGIAGIFLVLGDAEKSKTKLDLNVLWPAIHAAHTQAGAEMVKRWGLTEEMAMVVGAHHDISIQGQIHPMAATVCVAEALTLEFDRGLMPAEDAALPDCDEVVVVDHESDVGQITGMTGTLDTGAIDRSNPNTIERAKEALGINASTLALIRDDALAWVQAEESAAPV